MSDKTYVNSGGISFCGLLTLVFIVAKLWGQIDWSWLWVLSPIWIPFAVVVGGLLAVGGTLLSVACVSATYTWLKTRLK